MAPITTFTLKNTKMNRCEYCFSLNGNTNDAKFITYIKMNDLRNAYELHIGLSINEDIIIYTHNDSSGESSVTNKMSIDNFLRIYPDILDFCKNVWFTKRNLLNIVMTDAPEKLI